MPSTSPPRAAWARTASMIGGAAGDRAAAQIVAIAEAARQHDEVGARGQFGVGVPDDRRLAAGRQLQRARHVAFAIGAGKDDDGGASWDVSLTISSTR